MRAPNCPITDVKTGVVAPEWLRYFQDVADLAAREVSGGGNGGTTPPLTPVAPARIITIAGADVNIGSGTIGALAKWLQPTILGDSIITEGGGFVSVAGTLSAFTVNATRFVGDGSGLRNFLDYLGDYVPVTYNDGDIVVGSDGIAYLCVKDGTTTPPDPWPLAPSTLTPHHATHEPGGGDEIVNINAARLTTGALLDARLSANVLKVTGGYPGGTSTYLRADGTFVAPAGGGNITGPATATVDNVAVYADGTGKLLRDSLVKIDATGNVTIPTAAKVQSGGGFTCGTVSANKYVQELPAAPGQLGIGNNLYYTGSAWNLTDTSQYGVLYRQLTSTTGVSVDWLFATAGANPRTIIQSFAVDSLGGYAPLGMFERGRTIKMGEWQTMTPVWSDGTNTGVIGNGQLYTNYTLIGKTCFFIMYLQIGSTTVIPSGGGWNFTVPIGNWSLLGPGGVMALNSGVSLFTGSIFPWAVNSFSVLLGGRDIPGQTSAIYPWTWKSGDYLRVSSFYQMP